MYGDRERGDNYLLRGDRRAEVLQIQQLQPFLLGVSDAGVREELVEVLLRYSCIIKT